MARRKLKRESYDTINLTPLIDTLFFLLIIFMVTAPLLEYSVDVKAPEMNATPLPKDDPDSKVVNLRSDGLVEFERRKITQDQFLDRLAGWRNDDQAKLFLRADSELTYGQVVHFLNQIRKSGFQNIFLVTSEERD